MTAIGTFSVHVWCLCGGTMEATGAGDASAAVTLQNLFWQVHDGPGHGPSDPKRSAAARRKAARRVGVGA